MSDTKTAAGINLLLDETYYYKTLASNKKRPLYLHEWLLYVDKNIEAVSKPDLKRCQAQLLKQLLELFNAYPGPPLRQLIAKNIASLYTHGDILSLHETIDRCNELFRSKEHETQMHKLAKLCALATIGELYYKLGRMVGKSYETTLKILLAYMKSSADAQFKIEILETIEKMIYGLGSAGQSTHKEIYKQLKTLVSQERLLAVRCAAIKCLCEMSKHSTFLYTAALSSSSQSTAASAAPSDAAAAAQIVDVATQVCSELATNVQLGFKALDNSNYDVRVCVSVYLAQLIYYSLMQLQQQQIILQQQQQMANVLASAVSQGATGTNAGNNTNASETAQAKRQQQLQQQNMIAQHNLAEKLKNTLGLLSNGFNKLNSSGGFNLMRSAASGLVSNSSSSTSASNQVQSAVANQSSNSEFSDPSQQSMSVSSPPSTPTTSTASGQSSSSSSSAHQINREVRIGVTYAYVELANLLGSSWLERNLKLLINSVLSLVNGTKSVATHLDAVYSRKCVQFILRSIIGGMLNEKMQLEAARLLLDVVDRCTKGVDFDDRRPIAHSDREKRQQQQHVLICALHELACILRTLNTSASILAQDDLVTKILTALVYPNNNEAVKCEAAWCLRSLASSLPALMTPLLDSCMDKLSLIRNPSDALLGYGYACASLLGAVRECPLGVPSLKAKLAFNIAEELLRSASQSANPNVAMHKASVGWLLMGGFMSMGSIVVRKHLNRVKKLWLLTMPSSLEQLEQEKRRGDANTWQLSLETRTGALASIHSFLTSCADMFVSSPSASSDDQTQNPITSVLGPIESAIMLLSQLPNIIKLNQSAVSLRVKAAMFRLRLYQTLLALPQTQYYEHQFGLVLSELVAEFTLADANQTSALVTSKLRSVCHSNESSILFASSSSFYLQDKHELKALEDQLLPHSASGCEALEHDLTYLYQRVNDPYAFEREKRTISEYSNGLTDWQAALPLGVSVIDASIQLYGQMYPKVPNKHRLQMLLHFADCVNKQASSKANAANRQALQINIFTAVLSSLKALAETKSDIGDEPVKKATLRLVMETLTHSNPVLRCAAGEALGRMAQVIAESPFVVEVATYCFDRLKLSQTDAAAKTGYALGLGCLHRYVGSMGAGQHVTSSVSILFGMAAAQNQAALAAVSTPTVQIWAIHALYLIIDSGGSMFRNYIEPCVEFILQSTLSNPYTNRDVFVALGKLLNSIITFLGPELQAASDIRTACLTTCAVMQKHSDPVIRAESIECMQSVQLFAPKHVSLHTLVPLLIESLVSREFLLRRVACSCLRQLCQRDSLDVCRIARQFVLASPPVAGLLVLVAQRGLEYLLFKLLDIETNAALIRDLHDILLSLLCTSFNERTLKHWLFLCKDIAISTEESLEKDSRSSETRIRSSKKQGDDEKAAADEDMDEGDDAESFQIASSRSNEDIILAKTGGKSAANGGQQANSSSLKLKQITKMISPKWPNRVFAFELIRRILRLCDAPRQDSERREESSGCSEESQKSGREESSGAIKKRAHFDLKLAKKLKSESTGINRMNSHSSGEMEQQQQQEEEENFLILFLQDLMRVACIGATSSCDPLKLVGLDLLNDLILAFAHVEEPNAEFKGHLVLEQYQAQVSAALRPQFSQDTSAHVTAKACYVCSRWISSGIARDLGDLRRVHQLLVSSLQKLSMIKKKPSSTNNTTNSDQKSSSSSGSNENSQTAPPLQQFTILQNSVSSDQLIYSELSLTIEKLAVLRSWAEVYVVAKHKADRLHDTSLLSLVKPEMPILSYHWYVAMRDYAFLSLSNEYVNQLPIEGGAFYHADLVESSRPIYREHFTKILLAYSLWLNEVDFDIHEQFPMSPKQSTSSLAAAAASHQPMEVDEHREKIFFMLLGLGTETLSNTTTGLGQLSDQTVENILESLDYLFRTSFGRNLLLTKSVYLCVEILSVLYKVKLTSDVMSINLLVMSIVRQINELRMKENSEGSDKKEESDNKWDKKASALIFVILEICVKDLIKYLPDLLNTTTTESHHQPTKLNEAEVTHSASSSSLNASFSSNNKHGSKSSFLYLHVAVCKQIASNDVELIRNVLVVLNQLPFHSRIQFDKRLSLILINYHILFSFLRSLETLVKKEGPGTRSALETTLLELIYGSFKLLCSASNSTSKWYAFVDGDEDRLTRIVRLQQSALLSTLALKDTTTVSTHVIMKLVSIHLQQCSSKVFEPMNVYEKCKVFMCSLRCSDSRADLLCLVACLNDVLRNKQTSRDLRVILLKEHISYLLKLASTSTSESSQPSEADNSMLLAVDTSEGRQLVAALLDLFEAMVFLVNDPEVNIDPTDNETLNIYIHILGKYLNDSPTTSTTGRANELNELVIQKILTLGKEYKQELKQALDKSPLLKTKFSNALRISTSQAAAANSAAAQGNEQRNQASSQLNKAPKIQLNFNFSKK